MNLLGNSIKELRKSRKMTQNELAALTGFKQNTISNHENGNRQLDETDIRRYADAFNVSPQELFNMTRSVPAPTTLEAIQTTSERLEEPRRIIVLDTAKTQLEEQERASKVDIEEPLTEYHVYEKLSAGIGSAYFEDRNYDTVFFNKDLPHDLASWVYGDSMEPDYPNGSVALIKDTGYDYDGAVYAVDWDGQSYIKKVYKEKDGMRLVSLNKKYDDKFAAWEEEPRIIGKVIGNFKPIEI